MLRISQRMACVSKDALRGGRGATPENDPLAFPQARLLPTLLAEQLGAMDVQVLHATAKRGILQTSKSTDFSGVIRYCGCAGLFPRRTGRTYRRDTDRIVADAFERVTESIDGA